MTDSGRYSGIFDNAGPAAAPRAKQLTGKYDSYFAQQDRAAAQVNVLDAPNPDVAARANRYERDMGVPAALARDDIHNYDAMARQREVARLSGQLPAFAKFMADPRNAAVAHDDNSALGTIGKIFQTYSNQPAPAPTAKPKTWTQSLLDAPRNVASSLYAGVGQASQGLVGIAKAAIEVKDQIDPFNWIDYAITGREGRGGMPGSEKTAAEKEANGTAMLDRIIGLQQNEITRSTVSDEGFIGNSIYSGIQSIPSSVAALVNPAAGLGLMGASTGGQNYVQARQAGVSPANAATYGARQGATEVLTEKLGPSGWIDGLKAGSPFLKRMGQYLYKDVGGELLATTVQNFDQWATIESNQGKTFGDYVKQLPADLAQTAIAAITTGAATTGAVELASKTAERIDHAVTARRSERALAGVMDAAAASKLRKRDPEAFKQFVEQATEGTLTENAYVPVEAIDTLMQTEGFEDQDGFFGALQQQIVDARATGGDVVIPVSDIASKLAGTPAWDALKDDTRLEAGGLSPKEMRVEGDAILKTIQTRGDEIAKAADSEATRAEPARQVFDEVKGQLTGIGRSDREATNLAAVYAARAEAWGERLGVSATDYHAKYPVEFKSDVGTTQAAAPNVMEQPGSPAFDKWFGDSKVVDDQGVPLTVYHGTTASFDAFAKNKRGSATRDMDARGAFFFSNEPRVAHDYSTLNGFDAEGQNIVPAYISLRNPLVLDMKGRDYDPAEFARWVNQAKDEGRDGVVFNNTRDGTMIDDAPSTSYAVFEPTQIKSAIGNRGTYDPNNPSMLEQNPGNGARGQIALGANGTNVITLFENANLSTLLHETGHQFLEELQRNAADPAAPDSVREDWEKVKAWFVENGVWHGDAGSTLSQITPEQASETSTPIEMPSDPLFSEAVSNTAGAEITPEGLRINLVRVQKPEQEGQYSVRTGVFYLPKGSSNLRHYKKAGQPGNYYGGSEMFEGETVIRRPLFVKGATGGKAPEAAYEAVKGKGALKKLEQEMSQFLHTRHWMERSDPGLWEETVDKFLQSHGVENLTAYDVHAVSQKGNQLRYAIQELVIAHAIRDAGYDAMVGYSKGKNGASVSEVFDVREQTYPSRSGDSEVHDSFYQDGKDSPPVVGNIPREAHELWARGFERYAMEGKAPSSALQSAFAAFRGWLLRIYQVVQNLRAPITPEVREVMDRMLATQSAIDEFAAQQNVKAAWTDAKQAGMTDAEFAAYQRSLVEAKDDAYDALLFKTMHRIAQRKKLEYSAEAKAIRAEATQAINEEPRFRALRLLRTGKLGDTAVDGAKLNSEWLVDRFGDDALERLPKGPAIYSKTGIDADELAELTGFSSGAEMVQALFDVASTQAEQRAMGDKRQLRDTLIDNATNAAIEAKGLVDPLTDGSIEEEAIAAISNDRQGEVFATELRHLARRTKSQPTPYRLARDWAKAKIEAGRVKDVASRSALQRYARAAAKSSRAFEEAIVAGNTDEAFRHKQAQMLNHALFVEAKNAADNVDTIVARMNKLGKRAAMKSVDQDYFDRVHDLLERYDFRPRSQRFLAERDRFENWAARRAAEGFEVLTPDRLNVAGQHYSQTTVEELHGLRDAVDSLMSLGRLKQKFLDAKTERDFADFRAAVLANLGKQKARVLPERTFNEDTARKTLRTRIAGGIKISTLALDMDHQDPNGPMMNLLSHRVSDQSLMRDRLRESVLAPIAKQLGGMTRAKWKRLDELVTTPELTLNRGLGPNDQRLGKPLVLKRRDLLAIAANTGNASNLDKMAKGEGWNPETVRAVLDRELNADDWKLVQQMWDSVGSLWPHIVHTERQLSGVVPEKVEATPITNRHGTFAGGYWPVVYDPERSAIGEANEIKSADDMFGRGSGLGTPKGHTITRTEANGPMVYSLEHVLFKHVEQVITRLSFAEYARDVMRVLKDDAIRGEIDLKLGKEYRQEIPLWLQDLILPVNDGKAGDWTDSLLRFSRQGIVAVGMGLRFGTGVAQISGLASSIARLGGTQTHKLFYHVGKQVLAGVGNMARGQRSEIHEFVFERSEMMARRLRENTVEVEKASRKLRGKHSWKDTITPWQFWHIGMVDLHVVSIPTWITGYRDAISRGMTEEQAAKYGDQMVGTSQGSGRQEHLARWQRSQSEAKKIFYMFYTPFNVIFNAQWEAARGVKRGDYTRAANLTFFMLVAQTLADAALSGDWPGGGDDDGDESAIRQWAEWAGRNILFGLFSGVPLVRDMASTGERMVTGQYAQFGGTPTGRIFEEMGRSASALYKVEQGEKDFEPNMVPGLANSAGMALHLPLGQPGQTTKFLWQYKRDEVHPQSIGDWYTGLTKGKIAEEKE